MKPTDLDADFDFLWTDDLLPCPVENAALVNELFKAVDDLNRIPAATEDGRRVWACLFFRQDGDGRWIASASPVVKARWWAAKALHLVEALDRFNRAFEPKMIGIAEAAQVLGVDEMYLRHIVDVGDVKPTTLTGEVWDSKSKFQFSRADLDRFAAEIAERRFPHVLEQHGYVVDSDATFSCGPGWERLIRELATGLSGIAGPPRLHGGKEKFGSFQASITYSSENRSAVEALKEKIRKKSVTVCEQCGQPGRLRMSHARAQTLCDRHARLAEPLRDDDGQIVDLPPTGGPIFANGSQGNY